MISNYGREPDGGLFLMNDILSIILDLIENRTDD